MKDTLKPGFLPFLGGRYDLLQLYNGILRRDQLRLNLRKSHLFLRVMTLSGLELPLLRIDLRIF